MAKETLWAILVMGLLITQPLLAADHHDPANFRADKHPIDLIEYPVMRRNHDVLIRCASLASPRGYLRETYCLDDGHTDLAFHRAAQVAMNKARTNTPRSNGWRKYVWFQYTFRFIQNGSNRDVVIYPHWKLNGELLGDDDYTAPQEIPLKLMTAPKCYEKDVYWISLVVHKSGKISDVDFLDRDMTRKCKRRFSRYLSHQKFIPAYHNGEPVTARHVDVYFTYRTMKLAAGRNRDYLLVDSSPVEDILARNDF